MPGRLVNLLLEQQFQRQAQQQAEADRTRQQGADNERQLLQTAIDKYGAAEKDIWDLASGMKYLPQADVQVLATAAKLRTQKAKELDQLQQITDPNQLKILGEGLVNTPELSAPDLNARTQQLSDLGRMDLYPGLVSTASTAALAAQQPISADLAERIRAAKAREAAYNARTGVYQGLQGQKIIENYQGQYTRATQKLTDRQQYADAAQQQIDLAKQGNPIAGEAAKTQIARLSGEVGNLTENDVARFGGSKAVTSRLAAIAQQALDGTVTAENLGYLQQIVDVFGKSITRNKQRAAALYAGRLRRAKVAGQPVVTSNEDAWSLIDNTLPLPGQELPAGAITPKQAQSVDNW